MSIDGTLQEAFDAVVMLTWSDWRTEPRSNRYHYATRFARHWPIYFVQLTEPEPGAGVCEAVDGHDITIVHAGPLHGERQSDLIAGVLRANGVKRPLYWVYNPRYADFIERYPGRAIVYHATEDYLGEHDELSLTDDQVAAHIRRLLTQTDLAIAVTDSVAAGIRKQGRYAGPLSVIRNGCDAGHWRQRTPVASMKDKIAFYQGGINERLDFQLLHELVDRMPDWRFWFCGDATHAPQPQWSDLLLRPNVKWFGRQHADKLPALQAQATVGLIPFRQTSLMRASLPLKAYEYVASGLPVVSIPIDELAREPELFRFASNAAGFAREISEAASTRSEAAALQRRNRAADAASYDRRFSQAAGMLAAIVTARAKTPPRRNVLVLYDNASTYVGTIREHLESFGKYSMHQVHYLPATGQGNVKSDAELDFSMFDVVILHYSVRISTTFHLMEPVARALEKFHGLKIAFLQDEYETVNTALGWLKRLRFDLLFSCIPIADAGRIYSPDAFPWMRIVPTLTGYIPDDPGIEVYQRPLAERKWAIGYRGRRLSHCYGDLGQEKIRIGVDVRREAEARGVPVNIEIDEEHRIYGLAWYEFLANSRATLGTESGSNVFDFDGTLIQASRDNPQMPYEEFRDRFLAGREGPIRMNQISPKAFEAIRLRVALVFFEGEYSGVLKPGVHYMPLKKDLSNIDDVFAKLDDLAYLEALVERAYRDIVEDGQYSYRDFIAAVDAEIETSLGFQQPRSTIISMPTFVVRRGELHDYPQSDIAMPGSVLLPDGVDRLEFLSLLGRGRKSKTRQVDEAPVQAEPLIVLPEPGPPDRRAGLSRLSYLREQMQAGKLTRGPLKMVGRLWDVIPGPLKVAVRRLVR